MRASASRRSRSAASAPDVWLLGSSDDSAALAAHFGLPFCYAHFINPDGGDGVTRAYLTHFKPSALHPEPKAMMAMGVMCAETDEEADLLSKSRELWAMRLRTTDEPGPFPPVEEALEAEKDPRVRAFMTAMRRRGVTGSPKTVRAGIEEHADALQGRRDHAGDDLPRLREAQTLVRVAGRSSGRPVSIDHSAAPLCVHQPFASSPFLCPLP